MSIEAPNADSGQVADATPVAAPTGQADTTQTAAIPDTGTTDAVHNEPSFFDPKTLSPELIPAYKQMQGAFTRKMQEIAGAREKIAAFDAFQSDPVTTLQQLAGQYGYSMTRAEARQAIQQQDAATASDEWTPQSWDEVLDRAKDRARAEILAELGPVIGTVKQVQARNIEAQLDDLDPTWREYEGEMQKNLRDHPTLVKNIAALYRLSVPSEVWEARATQAALRKLESRTQAAQGAGKTTARKAAPNPPEIRSFSDAVEAAKRQLAGG